jgi:hypothetical protein
MRYAGILLTLLCLSACGVKFSDTPIGINLQVPGKLNTVVEPSLYRHNLNALLGNIAIYDPQSKGADSKLRAVRPAYPSGGLPPVTLIPRQNGQFYHSVLTSTAGFSADNPLASLKLDAKHSAEVTVYDVAQSIIESIPVEEIRPVYRNLGVNSAPNGTYYVYIRNVTLVNIKTNVLTEISSSASGVVGPAIGINGKVFNKSQTDIDDYRIIVDMAKLTEIFPSGPDGAAPQQIRLERAQGQIVPPAPTAPPLPSPPSQ